MKPKIILVYRNLLIRMAEKVEKLVAAKDSQPVPSFVTQVVGGGRPNASAAWALPVAPKPSETWSIVVKSPNKEGCPNDVA